MVLSDLKLTLGEYNGEEKINCETCSRTIKERRSLKKEKSHLYVGLFDILPDDVDTDLDAMMEAVKEAIAPLKVEVESWDSEEMAYGLKKVKTKIAFPDSIIGGTEPIEQAIMVLMEISTCGMHHECYLLLSIFSSILFPERIFSFLRIILCKIYCEF